MDTLNGSSADDFIDFERELAVFGQTSGNITPEVKSMLAELDDLILELKRDELRLNRIGIPKSAEF